MDSGMRSDISPAQGFVEEGVNDSVWADERRPFTPAETIAGDDKAGVLGGVDIEELPRLTAVCAPDNDPSKDEDDQVGCC